MRLSCETHGCRREARANLFPVNAHQQHFYYQVKFLPCEAVRASRRKRVRASESRARSSERNLRATNGVYTVFSEDELREMRETLG